MSVACGVTGTWRTMLRSPSWSDSDHPHDYEPTQVVARRDFTPNPVHAARDLCKGCRDTLTNT